MRRRRRYSSGDEADLRCLDIAVGLESLPPRLPLTIANVASHLQHAINARCERSVGVVQPCAMRSQSRRRVYRQSSTPRTPFLGPPCHRTKRPHTAVTIADIKSLTVT